MLGDPAGQVSQKGVTYYHSGHIQSLGPGLLPGLGEFGCAPPPSPPTSVSPRGINRKKITPSNQKGRRCCRQRQRGSGQLVGGGVPHPPRSQPLWGTTGGGDAGESDGGWALGPGEEGRKGSESCPGPRRNPESGIAGHMRL